MISYTTIEQHIGAGLSVIPAVLVPDKRPDFYLLPKKSWKPFQTRFANKEELERWQKSRIQAIAMVVGPVSDNVEALDFDNHFKNAHDLLGKWKVLVSQDYPELIGKLTIDKSMSGGFHVYWKCSEYNFDDGKKGSEVLAYSWDSENNRKNGIIELKHKNCCIHIAPSPGYSLIQNDYFRIPNITLEERDTLLNYAASLNEYIEPEKINREINSEFKCVDIQELAEERTKEGTPWHEYNQRASVKEVLKVLEDAGWYDKFQKGTIHYMTRPGSKTKGVDATYDENYRVLYVFSTSAHPFGANRGYSNFSIYNLLRNNGDFKKSALELAKQGYGTFPSIRKHEKETSHKLNIKEFFIIPFTDQENAKRFIKLYGDVIKYNHTSGQWYYWNKSHWRLDEKCKIIELAKEMNTKMYFWSNDVIKEKSYWDKKKLTTDIKKMQEKSRIYAILSLAQSDPKVAVVQSELDVPKYLFNFKNGTYDLEKMIFREHRKQDLLTKITNTEYKEGAIPHRFNKEFMQLVFDDNNNIISFVQRLIGYSMTADIREEILIFCFGGGKNGKSVFFNVMEMMFGNYFKQASVEMILAKQNESVANDLAMLPGIRFLCCSEMPQSRRLNEEKIKNLTGHDLISARYLYKEYFEFFPTHTLWMYGNHKPQIWGTDEGIWRRMIFVPFTVTIPDNLRKSSSALLRIFNEERAGIANFMLKGWKDYLEIGLDQPNEVRDFTNSYRESQDVLADFINCCCEINPEVNILAKDLYKAYEYFSKNLNNDEPVGNRTFFSKLEEKGFLRLETRHAGMKCFKGIKLNNEFLQMLNGKNIIKESDSLL